MKTMHRKTRHRKTSNDLIRAIWFANILKTGLPSKTGRRW